MKNFFKKSIVLILSTAMCFNCLAAAVSDNDGSAFITKSEFDSLKNNFQSQIDQYNTSIDSKIDTAISAYLSGIKVSTKTTLKSIINSINDYGYNYNGMAGYPFTNGNVNLACTTQTPEVNVVGIFCYQNLGCGGSSGGVHHAGGGRGAVKAKTGAGTAWEFTTISGYRCLTKYMNVYEILNFTIGDAPAVHSANNYGLAHTYQNKIRNETTDLNDELITQWQGGFLMRNSSGTYATTGLASGGAYLTLTKSIFNTDNNARRGYMAPIGNISTATYGYGYNSGTNLGSILTDTDPIGKAKATDNYQAKFPDALYYAHTGGTCMFSDTRIPATSYAYEHLYWNKHFVNTSRFALTDLYIYPATMAYGEGVRYYNGLPVCTNKSSKGTLTFKMKPVTTSSGATRVDLCFRSEKFANGLPTSDSAKNIKNIKYKAASATDYQTSTSLGVCENLVPGTEYQFEIQDFPDNSTLWVKPNRVQRNSESTQVYAYLTTVDDIVIESDK
ncbi:MAG: hypothetical protein IJP71_00580 [Lachnospiraceae bacterium]|nr:hypothetical protein [Lachnospiraceae bacterium]